MAYGYRIGVVTEIRQYARTGTKGWMEWVVYPSGQPRILDAVWAGGARLDLESMLMVDGRYGDGEHHQETVFYINGIKGWIDRRDNDGWLREEARRRRELALSGPLKGPDF